ncbi:DegT/DnrJ/EryC1/StrS family aminotransferase [Streptomyces sp. BPTC-684]|uniref:DegT/DnrJ/EryC1/StrS family aminotransferase n=1 Tax=Streptomyces sp. BPTC-684 TaxID=3043734 RepID=UPI0024B06526|nr:DegT/DnrJ/EryC1/StrS family aminotransferase [Streptomyces sp. BPTC-684]WHM36190.1 DegT/DnrJ/EryC1/StrS family aminotransferase [Streptomyces sp. BPTC-684]
MGIIGKLESAGFAAGDEVIVPAYDDGAVARAVVAAGALPVFADIDPDTYCLGVGGIEAVVTSRTVGLVLVHRFGHPADAGQFGQLADRLGLLLVEKDEDDGAGGDVVQRRERAGYLDRRLVGVRTPVPAAGHGYQRYVVRVPGNGRPDRDAFARLLRRRGVECEVPVVTPVHRTREFRRVGCVLPQTERAVDETLALPRLDGLSDAGVRKLVSVCNALGGLLQPA